MSISFADRPRRQEDVSATRSGGTRIVTRPTTRVEVALNPTAFALWQLCDGHTTVAEMIQAVCDLFEVTPDLAERDVMQGIARMREAGILR